MAAVATGISVGGAGGVALGVVFGLLLSRLGSFSTRVLRKANGRLVPDPSRKEVTPSRIVWAHLAALGLEFTRGCGLSLTGLVVGGWISVVASGNWPLEMPGTLTLLALGASIPAGALVGGLGGWRRRGVLFGAGVAGFLLASLVL